MRSLDENRIYKIMNPDSSFQLLGEYPIQLVDIKGKADELPKGARGSKALCQRLQR